MSKRRPCSIVAADGRSSVIAHVGHPIPELRACLRDLANQRRGSVLAGSSSRRGKKTSQPASTASNRLYRQARRAARKCKSRGKAAGSCAPILVATKPIARRSVDFFHDQLAEFGYNRRWMRVQWQTKWGRAVTTRRRFAGSGSK